MASRTIPMACSCESALSRNPSRLGPPQPRPTTLTLSPVLPRVVYSIGSFFLDRRQRSSSKFEVPGASFQESQKFWLCKEFRLNPTFHWRCTLIPNTSPIAHTCPAALTVQLIQAL